MKYPKTALLLLLCCLCAVGAAGCEKNKKVNFGEYQIETGADVSAANPYALSDLLQIDTGWMSAYALSYAFYDKTSGDSEVTEGKCAACYQAVDSGSGQMTYLTQEDGYMLQYVLDPAKKQGTCAIVTEGSLSQMYSGFAQLSACDPYLPVYENVTKMGSEPVARRPATKYKQIEKDENGSEARVAYIWVDDEYGFASRCELYQVSDGALQMSWTLKSFTRGVKEENVRVDLTGYEITQK